MTSQTLIGNYKGQADTDKILPVLQVAFFNAILIALTFALVAILFPDFNV